MFQWDLVCDQKYLSSLATTIYFCGVMVGGVLFGHLADKFGRKPVMLTCIYMPVIVGVATAFSPWYSIFVGLRFIQGILMQVNLYSLPDKKLLDQTQLTLYHTVPTFHDPQERILLKHCGKCFLPYQKKEIII